MSVNYSAGLSPYENKGKCGMPEKNEDNQTLLTKCHQLKELLKTSRLTVVHTGAGISTSAGIPDFRGPTGVWTLEKQGKSPECSTTFDTAKPTFSHRLLVLMEKLGFVHYIVSQNVDGLHLRSGFPRDRLAELHGNMFTQRCQLCNREFVMDSVSPTMGLKLTGYKCTFEKARGGRCRGHLRDSILDWEDSLPVKELEMSERISKCADLSIVLGSSLQIFPAANLPLLTKRNGGKLVIVNLQSTRLDKKADLLVHGYIDKVLKLIAEELSLEVPDYNGPSVRLKSSNPLPSLYVQSLEAAKSNRKRKSKVKKTKFENNDDCEVSTSLEKKVKPSSCTDDKSSSTCDEKLVRKNDKETLPTIKKE